MHGLEAEYFDMVNFVYLDIDDPASDPFKLALGYRYQPHIFLVDEDGNLLQQWVGPVTREDLAAAINAAVSE